MSLCVECRAFHELVLAYGAPGAALILAAAVLMGALVGGLANHGAAKFVRGFRRCEAAQSALDAGGQECTQSGSGKEGFTARYVLACVLGAAYFASVVGAYGLGIHALALCALGGILLSMALVDLDASIIPNRLVLAGIAVWAATFAFWDVEAGSFGIGGLVVGMAGSPWLAVLIDGLAGAILVAGVALVLSLALDMATGRPSLGGGDVKLLFMVGLFLGVAGSVLSLMVACAVGVVFWLATRNVRTGAPGQADSGATRDSHAFPFGPSIALATWLTLIAGPSILNWYFGVS